MFSQGLFPIIVSCIVFTHDISIYFHVNTLFDAILIELSRNIDYVVTYLAQTFTNTYWSTSYLWIFVLQI